MPKVTKKPVLSTPGPAPAPKPKAVKPKPAKPAPSSIDAVGGAPANPGLASAAPAVGQKAPGELIKALAAQSSYKVVQLVATPTEQTGGMASWKLGDYGGRLLKPGEELMLEIPPQLRGRGVQTVVLLHRQNEPYAGDHDDSPGLTAVHVHATNYPQGKEWRHWNAPWGASGKEGAKFAEYRPAGDPESETEFDWHIQGHSPVGGYGSDKGELLGDALRVRSVGDDPVYVHRIVYSVLPPKPTTMDTVVFSAGTNIGDPLTGQGRKFGGGQAYKGKFPGALQLGSGGEGVQKLAGTGWKHQWGSLEIPLQPGKRMTHIDLALGDSMPDEKSNKDGGWGTPGYARLTITLHRADGKKEVLMNDQGVPPEGVFSATPMDFDREIKAGDKLLLTKSGSECYIMAARVGYR